jgi:hypothetical protein
MEEKGELSIEDNQSEENNDLEEKGEIIIEEQNENQTRDKKENEENNDLEVKGEIIIEEQKQNQTQDKKENEENNENELKKEVPPNHDYVYVPTNFKKLKESVVAENIEDDHDKENNDIKLNVSEKSNENLDLNKI